MLLATVPISSGQQGATEQNTIVLSWNGQDGLVDRTIAFRTTDLTEWASLWKPMFGSSKSMPQVDFEHFQIVGIILPRVQHRPQMHFDPQYEITESVLI